MSFCRNCGTQIPEGAGFCPNCGTRIEAHTPPVHPVSDPLPPVESVEEIPGAEPVAAATAILANEPTAETPVTEPSATIPEGDAIPAPEPLTQPMDAQTPYAPAYDGPTATIYAAQSGQYSAPYGADTFAAEPAPAQKKKSGGKAVAAIIAACCAVAALAVALLFIFKANSPEKLIATAFSRTANDLITQEDKDFFEHGSVTLSADLAKWDLDAMGVDEIPLAAAVKFCFGGTDYAAMSVDADYDGNDLLELSLYESKEQVVLTCDPLLSESYGTDVTKFKENLPKSVFAPGGVYDIGEDLYDALMQAGDQQLSEKDLKAYSDIFGRYAQLLLKSACKEGNAKKEAADLTAGTETIKTTAVTLTLDGNALANVLTELYDTFVADDELRAHLTAFASGFDLGEQVSDGYYFSMEEALEELYNSRDEFEDAMQELRQSDIVMTPVFYVAKSNKHLAALRLSVDEDGETGEIKLVLGEDLRTAKYITFQVCEDSGAAMVELTRYISEDTADTYRSKLVAKEYGESLLTAEYKLDRTKDLFTLTVDADGETIELSGTQKTTDNGSELTVQKITVDNMPLEIDLKLTVNRKEPTVKAPAYKEVLKLSEEDIDNLMTDVEENAYSLAENCSDLIALFSGGGSVQAGDGGDIVGDWGFAYEGFEDALYFVFYEDGTAIFGSYDEYYEYSYETYDGILYLTDPEYGYTEEYSYSVEGDTLYLEIEGEMMEFIRR